jgi:hypothetical protein
MLRSPNVIRWVVINLNETINFGTYTYIGISIVQYLDATQALSINTLADQLIAETPYLVIINGDLVYAGLRENLSTP